jgi:hypothetical protein
MSLSFLVPSLAPASPSRLISICMAPIYLFTPAQEIAFLSDVQHMHRLIMHEKCHFMWANLFSASIRADWAAVGGWSEDAAATSGWTTSQTTQVQCLSEFR